MVRESASCLLGPRNGAPPFARLFIMSKRLTTKIVAEYSANKQAGEADSEKGKLFFIGQMKVHRNSTRACLRMSAIGSNCFNRLTRFLQEINILHYGMRLTRSKNVPTNRQSRAGWANATVEYYENFSLFDSVGDRWPQMKQIRFCAVCGSYMKYNINLWCLYSYFRSSREVAF